MGSDADKLAAPKLFGRKKSAAGTPTDGQPAAAPTGPEPETAEPETAEPETAEPEPTQVLPETVPAAEQVAAPEPIERPKPARPARELRLPALTGLQAAAFAGLVVGAFLVLATFGSLRGCSAIRGTSTCGGAAGFPLLLAIGIVAVVVGAALLRAFRVTSPGSDSFLAVALVAVLTTLFLGNHYDAWWMFLVVPALTIAAFALSHWVSVRFIDRAEG
jgi:hypothetical protein